MFTALTLSLALGTPVPPPAAPLATGVAPRLLELKAGGRIQPVERDIDVAPPIPVPVEKVIPEK